MNLTEGLEANVAAPSKRAALRHTIEQKIADTPSLLGTLSDAMGIVMVHAIADIVAASEHSDNAAQRRRLEIMQAIAGDTDIVALAQDTLTKLQAKEYQLTAEAKGLGSVVEETFARSTQTAMLLMDVPDADPET